MRSFILILILSLCFSARGAEMPDFPFVHVDGEAEIKVKPDRAKLTFELVAFDKDPNVAAATLSTRAKEILALAPKHGIPPEDISSSDYRKSTRRGKNENYEDLEIQGYEIAQTFTVQINQITKYAPFADQLAILKNVTNIASEFDVSNRKEVTAQLTKAAADDAKQKAESLAAGLGVKISSLFAASETFDFNPIESAQGSFGALMRAADTGVESSPHLSVPQHIWIKKTIRAIYKIM